ncbi:Glycerate 2-kinase [Pandoraea iniqua]|uniref:Glycerate 2-kinase n=1 Tax=Pandoraea iniqua TaxID=2508288 RepID=A0A5E4VDF3_9BURK|nr:glycerate kinase [Pandoraea iniqua]VVE10166.1 Glycerate 2-kinase [Pandoraea iniqua]
MKVVIAPDSFKESLSATEAAHAIRTGFSAIFPHAEFVLVPIADGGEGTVAALVRALGGEYRLERVSDPLGRPVDAQYGVAPDGVALIEVAAASGLACLTPAERNPLTASSRGTGELMLAALDAGLRRFVIGLGGSATNDAGQGILCALGARFLDENGHDIAPGGASLRTVTRVDVSRLDKRLRECVIELACDVDNPLCGETGASAIFGPQKGATSDHVSVLDDALNHFAKVLERDLSVPPGLAAIPGGGAAGGIGATLNAVLGARLRAGADIIAEASRLDDAIDGASLVITGEGRVDSQTVRGKAPAAVARIARQKGVPVIALGGSIGESGSDDELLYGAGIHAVFGAVRAPCTIENALRHAHQNLQASARNIAAAIRIGQTLS